jgi:Protein of unknown function (DUF3800)
LQLVFVDETSDNKNKQYFGLSIAVINNIFYPKIKCDFHKIISESSWNSDIEFKGSYLFSSSKGDSNVSIEERVEICSNILELNKSNINARMKFYYVKNEESKNQKNDYLLVLPKLLDKALKKAEHKNGKDLISVHCDYRNDIKIEEIFEAVNPVLKKKEYTLFENIQFVKSSFHTVGILYADLVGYLFARVDNIGNDLELFENLSSEDISNHGKLKKLKSSQTLMRLVKEFKPFQIKW